MIAIAKPRMEMLHRKFGETVNLARLIDNRAVYVHIIESREPFRISDNVGDVAAFHSTAIGKAIAAFLPVERQAELFKGYQFRRFTRKTISSLGDLKNDLKDIKAAGIAIDDEEGHNGVVCLGAPIFNNDHQVFAGISISMPKGPRKEISP